MLSKLRHRSLLDHHVGRSGPCHNPKKRRQNHEKNDRYSPGCGGCCSCGLAWRQRVGRTAGPGGFAGVQGRAQGRQLFAASDPGQAREGSVQRQGSGRVDPGTRLRGRCERRAGGQHSGRLHDLAPSPAHQRWRLAGSSIAWSVAAAAKPWRPRTSRSSWI